MYHSEINLVVSIKSVMYGHSKKSDHSSRLSRFHTGPHHLPHGKSITGVS